MEILDDDERAEFKAARSAFSTSSANRQRANYLLRQIHGGAAGHREAGSRRVGITHL
jgi:hypothetical protein